MPLGRVELTNIGSLDDFYRQLATQLPLPAHFGKNLDALFDVLTTDLEGPLLIIWHDHDAAAARLGYDDYTTLLAVLRDAANDRPDLQLVID